MLVITRTVRFHFAFVSIELPLLRCLKRFSCLAHHLSNEIPQRSEVQLSAGNGLAENCNVVFGNESAKPSNAHEALAAFCKINSSGTKSTRFLLCTALSSCTKTQNWHLGLQLHSRIIRAGYEPNLIVSTALVDFYAKCDAVFGARRVFDSMKNHDPVSWTSIISGLSQNGHGKEAISTFKEMLATYIKPNCVTYVSVISACTVLEEALEEITLLHGHVTKLGFNSNSFVLSALVDCYSKCGRIDQAVLLFKEAKEWDDILLNSMISSYSQNLYGEEALNLFLEMRRENLRPTNHTLTSLLSACSSLTVVNEGRQLHALVTKMGSASSVFVVTALIDMYSKCGYIEEACRVFDQTVQKNSVLWTSMVMGYAQSGRASDALELFEHLVTKESYVPDHICFTAVLTACNHAGFLDRGIDYFNRMTRDYGLVPKLEQYACLIDLYARNGHLRKAKEFMEEMPYDPNYVICSSFLHSCKVYGEVELGTEAAIKLFKMEQFDAASYVTLAHIYAKAGFWAEVAEIRKLMQQKGLRKSAGWSWVEVDNMVHVFSVGDATHPQSQQIYGELEKLNFEMKEAMRSLSQGNIDDSLL